MGTAAQNPGQVVLHYARAVDQRDWDALDGCFWPDGRVEGTRFVDETPVYLDKLKASLEPFSSTMHALHNQYVEEQADGTAKVDTYCVAYHVDRASGGNAPTLTVGVVYHDQMRRDGDEWRVAHRSTEMRWAEGTFLV
jgi:3-phenylpropionate/cinnamic acid dioxygenase small subunit